LTRSMIGLPRFTATSTSTSSTIGGCGGDWRTSRAVSDSRPQPPFTQSGHGPGFAARFALLSTRPVADHLAAKGDERFGRTAGPEVLLAGGQDLDVLLGPLVAYLHALEARVGARGADIGCSVDDGGGRGGVRPGQCGDDPAGGPGRRALGRRVMSAARPGSLAMPSTAGLPRDHQRRHRFLRSPAGVAAKGKRCRRGGMASAGLNVARQLGHGSWPTLETYGQVDGRVQRGAKARRGGRHHAGAQRPASRASGLDRIVGMMSASGPHETLPSNWGRGATMGPSGCSAQA